MSKRIEAAVAAADRIPGWMGGDELRWLAENARRKKVIVEVGSYRGRSTKVLTRMCPGVVVSVDNCAGEVDPPPSEFDAGPMSGKELDADFRKTMKRELERKKLYIIRKASISAARSFLWSADMIFIDGNHTFDYVMREVPAWRRRLAPGGLLCGHDAPDKGVEQALERLGITGRGPDRIWFDG